MTELTGFEMFEKEIHGSAESQIDFLSAAYRKDIGAVEAFCEFARGQLLYDVDSGAWVYLDPATGTWREDATKSVACKVTGQVWDALNDFILANSGALGCKLTEEQTDLLHKWGHGLNSHAGRESLLRMARGQDHMWASTEQWNVNPYALNCLNGVLDVKTGEFRDPDPDDFLTMRMNVAYDPTAGTGKKFQKVLDDVFEGDQDVIDYLQRCLGYSILGLKNGEYEQRFFFGYGPRGGNGKNTIFDPIMDILGSYGGIASAGTFNFDKSKIPEDLHQLRHTRVILASEPSQREQMDEEMVKAITGNKSVRTRQLHQNSVTWSPKFCVWMLANHYPKVPNSDSLFRRFVMFPFNRVFEKHERVMGLGQQLFIEEGSCILNWLIEGAQKWIKENLDTGIPDACTKTWEMFRESVDIMKAFIIDNVVTSKKEDKKQEATPLFARYKQWCHDNNYYPLGRNKFYSELTGYGAKSVRQNQGRIFTNLELKPQEGENDHGLF